MADRLRKRRVLLQLAGDKRDGRARRRRFQVGGDRLDVLRLPDLDAVDHDQPSVPGEETESVARRDDVGPARLGGAVELGRIVAEPAPQALKGAIDLRTVRACKQVHGLQVVRHRRQA